METQEPLDAVVDGHRMELAIMRRRAVADGHVSHEEAIRIFEYQDTHFEPAVAEMTNSWGVMRSIVRGSHGVYGPRARRRIKELWALPSNVVQFRRRVDQTGDAA